MHSTIWPFRTFALLPSEHATVSTVRLWPKRQRGLTLSSRFALVRSLTAFGYIYACVLVMTCLAWSRVTQFTDNR